MMVATLETPPKTIPVELKNLIKGGLKTLDLTPAQHEKATKEYEKIAEHIKSKKWFCRKYSPDVYPQGSMALGTCVRPIGKEEFDLDMVLAVQLGDGLTFSDLLDDLEIVLSDYNGKMKKNRTHELLSSV